MNETLLIVLTSVATLACAVLAWLLYRSRRGQTERVRPEASPQAALSRLGGPEEIIEHMGEGVLVVDDRLRPHYANRAARRLMGLRAAELPGRLPSVEVAQVARRALTEGRGAQELVEVFYPERRSLKVQCEPLEAAGAVLIVLEDVSEEVLTQRIRREFVSHASHELKSPVASIQALAEALNHAVKSGDKEAGERFSERVLSELERMGKLVNDLLDLSRLEDPAALPVDPCNLSAVTKREVAALERTAHERHLRFLAAVTGDVWVKGDPRQLALLVRNLLENALLYTPNGGEVSVSVKTAGDKAVLRVTDNGIGIPLESQSRIFERFYRVDRARSRDRGGTGLGLAIVKHVVELHGGTIEVLSELGQGSTFTIHIPIIEAITSEERTAGRDAGEKETA